MSAPPGWRSGSGRSPASTRATSSAIISEWFDLGVVGGAADVRREHHVVHGEQRVAVGQLLALEVVEPGAGRGGRTRSASTSASRSWSAGPGRVQVDRPPAHRARTGRRPSSPASRGWARRASTRRRTPRPARRASRGWRRRRRGRSQDPHAEALEPPADGAADGAEADEAGGAAGQLPRPEALVGDRAVAEHLAGAHVASAASDVRVTASSRATVISATPSALRPGARSTGMPLVGGAGDVDVGGVAPGRADGPQRPVEHRAVARSRPRRSGRWRRPRRSAPPARRRPRCAAGGWSIHGSRTTSHVLAQEVEARAPERRGHEGDRTAHSRRPLRT